MIASRPSERGQALVLLVLAIVGIFGFSALSLDLGYVYMQRRAAQGAADSAVLAGAHQKSAGQGDAVIRQAAYAAVTQNGFKESDITRFSISGPLIDLNGQYFLITMEVTTDTAPIFSQFVYTGELKSTVKATAKIRPSQPALPGFAIAAMGNCAKDGKTILLINGGGNRGSIEAFKGDIFINSAEQAGAPCAIDAPNSRNSGGIIAHADGGDPHHIQSVGGHGYGGDPKVQPNPIETGVNGGQPIGDPLSYYDEPICTQAADTDDYTDPVNGITYDYGPGNIQGNTLQSGTLAPGIYCVSGDIKLSGQEKLYALDGTTLYMINGGITFTGQSGFAIHAPDGATCRGSQGDRSASCNYAGMAIFSARTNTSEIGIRGNGSQAINGLVYALNGSIAAQGGGNAADDTLIDGQLISRRVLGNGNGQTKVTYNPNRVPWLPPTIELYE